MPQLSIIVPVYNAEQYLCECIDSILASSFPDFELLLVDNCSQDSSLEICKQYAAKDSRIRVLQEQKKGVSAARNCGLDAAKGRYFGFADSDDYIEPDMFKVLIQQFDAPDIAMTACSVFVDYSNGSTVAQNADNTLHILSIPEAAEKALSRSAYKGFLVNKLFLSDVIEREHLRLDETVSYCEDLLFVLSYLSHVSGKVHYFAKALYYYRIHGENVSERGFSERQMSGISALEKLADIVSNSWPELIGEIHASSVGMAMFLLRSIASGKADAEKETSILKNIVKQKARFYLQSKDTSLAAKLKCIVCRISPRIYMSIMGHRK